MPGSIVGLMAKYPQSGKVKTRLAKSRGNDFAFRTYKVLLNNVIDRCLPRQQSDYKMGCFVTPVDKTKTFEIEYTGLSFYIPQAAGDLGERMQTAFRFCFDNFKADKVILIGADIPELSYQRIDNGFTTLDNADLVWGPTTDGGYYLIGMKNTIFDCVLKTIDWGTSYVLKQSLEIATHENISYKLLSPLHDLDTTEDLKLFPRILSRLSK